MIELHILLGFMRVFLTYYVLQLGRCLLFSFLVFGIVLGLRKICKKYTFLKGMLWSFLILTPFVGKLKIFYEVRSILRLTGWWMIACMSSSWVYRIYAAGMIATGVVIWRRRRKVNHFVKGMHTEMIDGTKIYLCPCQITPFTTGVFSPKIVIPKVMLEEYDKDELKMILLHEKTHIRLGHLIFYFLWDILRILFWANPLFHFCLKYFKEDMEELCDRVTIQRGRSTGYEYGSLLLRSIRLLQEGGECQKVKAPFTFIGEEAFAQIRNRVKKVANHRAYKRLAIRSVTVVLVGLLTVILLGINSRSYARCEEDESIIVCDETGKKALLYDSPALREAITYNEQYLFVNTKKLKRLLTEKKVTETKYVIGFGGYTKMPGIGGGSNCIFVDDTMFGEENLQLPYERTDDFYIRLFKIL